MWPGRCIRALSVYRSRLAPWTRGESNHGKLSPLRPVGHGRYRFATASADDIHQLQQDTPAHNELRAPMNQFMERQFANQEPLRNNLLIPTFEVRINKAAKLRGDFAQMVHTISRNFTIRDTNQIMEQLILRCQGDLNVYIQNEALMHNHCMESVGSLGLTMLDTMLSVED